MDLQPAFAGSIPAIPLTPRVDANAIVRERLAARQQRTRRVRRRVIAAALSMFAALWTVIYVQLASGHDPALSVNLAAVTTTSSSTADATLAAQALHAKRHQFALKHRAARVAAQANAAAAMAAATTAATQVSSGAASTATSSPNTSSGTTSATYTATSSPANTPTGSSTPAATTTAAAAPAVTTSTTTATQRSTPAAAAPAATVTPAAVTTRQS